MNYLKTRFYTLKTLTPLHAGSGDTQYGVIDNLVQRDANTQLPTIHASSLKGALREYFTFLVKEKKEGHPVTQDLLEDIFGKEAKNGDPHTKPGGCKFLSADLLSRPVRSDKVPYFHTTAPDLLRGLLYKCENLGVEVPEGFNTFAEAITNEGAGPATGNPWVFEEAYQGAIAEENGHRTVHKADLKPHNAVTQLLGPRPMVMHFSDLKDLELPVVARNFLDNGISKNLWYEEVVPYDTTFGFFVVGPDELLNAFDTAVNGHTVQIGANASVGYGLCALKDAFKEEEQPATEAAQV